MKQTLLITGGSGYIGSHAVVAFEQAGYNCVIVDNFVNSSSSTLIGIEKILGYKPDFYEVDLRNKEGLEEIFEKYNFNGVIHFAGLKAFGESVTYPYMYYENNVYGSMILFDIMDRYGVHDVVFSSSASVYDASNTPPFTEDMKLGTNNPYATSKLVIENILHDYAQQKGFRCAILRYFNLVGAHESGNLGDFPRSNHGSLQSNIFDTVFGKKEKLYIYGDEFPTPDGTAIRDYIDVVDLIRGHLMAFDKIVEEKKGIVNIWNLGTGTGLSVKELIQVVEGVTKELLPTEVIAKRSIDLAIPISDPSKIKRDLGWEPKISIHDSMVNTWKFLLKNRKKNQNTKKKKVIHFTPYFPPHSGGVEMYVKEWIENYVKMGGRGMVVTFGVGQKTGHRNEGTYDVIVLPAFDIVHSFPFPMFWMPSFWTGIWKIYKYKADIIHTHTRFFLSSLLGGFLAKINKITWIHIEHGSGFVVSDRRIISKVSKIYDRIIGKWIFKNAAETIAVSEACEHFVNTSFGVKNTRTIYRGIQDSVISKNTVDKETITIGYVGRLVYLKGVEFLLLAFADFIKNYKGNKKIELQIVGEGPEKEKLEKLAKELSIQNYISFKGVLSVEEVRNNFLPSLDIFVNPSLQEGLPTSVIEALMSGIQVIATDVGGTREILNYAQFLLVAPKNIRSISLGLSQLSDSVGKKPNAHIPISLFSWEQTFRDFEESYNLYN